MVFPQVPFPQQAGEHAPHPLSLQLHTLVTVQVLVGGLVVVVPGADGRRCLRANDCGGLVRDANRGVGCYFIQLLLLTA